jgi:LmbE family N-acetylglucosaminyl deacetylase
MHWIYFSPHLDDACYSCGGMIWEQIHSGAQVEIWTICAGDPPEGELSPFAEEIHRRWEAGREAVAARRSEDREACRILGAGQRLFPLPDCIYRRLPTSGEPIIHNNEDLFAPVRAEEQPLIQGLCRELEKLLPVEASLISPLAIGGHMDHRLVRAAAELLGRPLLYYADFPYVVSDAANWDEWIPAGCLVYEQPVSSAGLSVWQRAVGAYRSQLSTFWKSEADMCAAMASYWEKNGRTGRLWLRENL